MPKSEKKRRSSGPRKRVVWMSLLNVKAHPHEDGAVTYT